MPHAKYRQAALIAQSALKLVIAELHAGAGEKSLGEICRGGDEFIFEQVRACYTKVLEKGIAQPTQICKNDVVSGLAPEETDKFQGGIANPGDVVKVSLGVHIDGYTVLAAHTVIIASEPVTTPFSGRNADAVIGSFLATEAVVGLLSSALSENSVLHASLGGAVNGSRVRECVDAIARAYDLTVVPGSQVRRIKRFVVGQPTVVDSMPAITWRPQYEVEETLAPENDDAFVAKSDCTYLIDIQMAPAEGEGYVKLKDIPTIGTTVVEPTVFTRNHSVNYSLRTSSARQLLGLVDTRLSVFPFKISYLEGKHSQLKLGLAECLQRHLILAEQPYRAVYCPASRPRDAKPVTVAREAATIALVSGTNSASGYPELVRLSGGKSFPPSWTHSVYALTEGLAASALQVRIQGDKSFRYTEVKPTLRAASEPEAPAENMDVEM